MVERASSAVAWHCFYKARRIQCYVSISLFCIMRPVYQTLQEPGMVKFVPSEPTQPNIDWHHPNSIKFIYHVYQRLRPCDVLYLGLWTYVGLEMGWSCQRTHQVPFFQRRYPDADEKKTGYSHSSVGTGTRERSTCGQPCLPFNVLIHERRSGFLVRRSVLFCWWILRAPFMG